MKKAYSWTERRANYEIVGHTPCPPQDPAWHYGMDKAVEYALYQLCTSVHALADFMKRMRVNRVSVRGTGTGLIAHVKWDTRTINIPIALTESGQPSVPGQVHQNKQSRTLDGIREELFRALAYNIQVDVTSRHLSDRVGELAATHLEKSHNGPGLRNFTVARAHHYALQCLFEHVQKLVGGWDKTGFPAACETILKAAYDSAPLERMVQHQRKKALGDARNSIFHAFANGATLEDLREVVDEELIRSLLET